MFSDHEASRSLHCIRIKWIRIVPHVARQEGRTDGAAIHAITVGFRMGGLARMKLRRRLGGLEHANARRQNIVESLHQILRRYRRFGGKRGHLGESVNPGVGAPGTLRQNLFAGHSSNSRGQCALDCGSIRLHLPSGKFRAVVGQNEF